MALILIGGGSRSGKSAEALRRARREGERIGFIATGRAFDDNMRERIERHKIERGPEIVTFEEPVRVAEVIAEQEANLDAIVVDCLTLWVSNLMLEECGDIAGESEKLVCAAEAAKARVILVTNEVGCGIVPDNLLAIRFRDEAGRLNQLAASRAVEVIWMIFGIRMQIK